jgi:hypothetical protein
VSRRSWIIVDPKNTFESLLRLEISATGCVTEINFDIEIFQYSCRQNCLRALPVALLQRLMTIPNAFSGFNQMNQVPGTSVLQ